MKKIRLLLFVALACIAPSMAFAQLLEMPMVEQSKPVSAQEVATYTVNKYLSVDFDDFERLQEAPIWVSKSTQCSVRIIPTANTCLYVTVRADEVKNFTVCCKNGDWVSEKLSSK